MEKIKNSKLRNTLCGALVAGALLVSGCRDREPANEMVNSNTRTFTGHASKEIVTDMDFDGKYDVLERGIRGKGRKLFYKKGYGPAQDPGIEFEFVDPDFFKHYDTELFKDMVKEFYRVETPK
jgi:hypothetical protein